MKPYESFILGLMLASVVWMFAWSMSDQHDSDRVTEARRLDAIERANAQYQADLQKARGALIERLNMEDK